MTVSTVMQLQKHQPGSRRFTILVGNTELKPNLASKHLTRHYSDVLLPLGITYEYRKTAAARLVLLEPS